MVARGTDEAVARRVGQHLEAGADHVALQVLTADQGEMPVAGWRALAPLVT